jgi:pimeloyl-ACP methyl ester carboxylesterase
VGNVSVEIWGTHGEPVVLVHGSGDLEPATVWEHQRRLAARYRLLLLTRPGYGARPVLPRATLDQDIDEILDVLEDEGGGHLIGYSYGGCIALQAAARRPELIHSLAVIEPPAFAVARDVPVVEHIIATLRRAYAPERPLNTDEFLVRFLCALEQRLPATFTLPAPERKGIEAMRAEPAPWDVPIPLAALARPPFPSLVLSGGWSPAFEAVADVLTERLGAEREVCASKGHYILDLGEPVNQRLETFLCAHGGKDGRSP